MSLLTNAGLLFYTVHFAKHMKSQLLIIAPGPGIALRDGLDRDIAWFIANFSGKVY